MAPTLGVNIAILTGDQILLTKRSDLPVWCLPGGGVEEGESFAQAAIRETYEETGLNVRLTRLVGSYSRPVWGQGDHNILFAAEAIAGTLQKVTNETTHAQYFHKDKLPQDLLWWFRQRIADVFEDSPAVARTQNAKWPFDISSRAEAYTRLEQGDFELRDIVQQLCQLPSPAKEFLDVGQK